MARLLIERCNTPEFREFLHADAAVGAR